MINKGLFLCTLSVILLSGCKDDKVEPPVVEPAVPQLEITVQPVFGQTTLNPTSVVTTAEGYDVQFTEIKFFVTNVQNNGHMLADVALYDWLESNQLLLKEGDKSLFGAFECNLGVEDTRNHADPAAFPNDSPLNISNADDMHWSWNPGYIFVKVEAKVDTIQDGTALFDHNVVFHVGTDVNLKTVNLSDLNWTAVDDLTSRLALKLDMQLFLQNNGQNIDLKTEFTTHSAPGQEALSTKVIENFKAAIDKL